MNKLKLYRLTEALLNRKKCKRKVCFKINFVKIKMPNFILLGIIRNTFFVLQLLGQVNQPVCTLYLL